MHGSAPSGETITPQFSPRLVKFRECSFIRARDAIETLLAESGHNLCVQLNGFGAVTAGEILGSAFRNESRVRFVTNSKETIQSKDAMLSTGEQRIVITSSQCSIENSTNLELLRWSCWDQDDVIAFMLEQSPEKCNSVVSRLQANHYTAIGNDCEIWSLLLERMCHDLSSVDEMLWRLFYEEVSRRNPSSRFGFRKDHENRMLARLAHKQLYVKSFVEQWEHVDLGLPLYARLAALPSNFSRLIAQHVASSVIERGRLKYLRLLFAPTVIERIAQELRAQPKALACLAKHFRNPWSSTIAAILNQTDKTWKPKLVSKLSFTLSYLPRIDWSGSVIEGCSFKQCDLSTSELSNSKLDGTKMIHCHVEGGMWSKLACVNCNFTKCAMNLLDGTCIVVRNSLWDECELCETRWEDAEVQNARFIRCDLSEADFSRARVVESLYERCILVDTDFRHSNLERSVFRSCDMRLCKIDCCNFRSAYLSNANLEDNEIRLADFAKADLSGSNWSGSRCVSVSFAYATLAQSKLADIQWIGCDLRGADLRGALFHYGSTRCGMVGSPYPSHGTRTGFYTDPMEELYYKDPEAVRKAAIIDSDLRGANIEGVNLYLVDLRGSQLDPWQREQATAMGAILDTANG
ncbi:MAG: pentapeptide repeat-containing protein [Pirellula sp.]